MSNETVNEKRKYPRIPKRVPIQIQELTYPFSNTGGLKGMGKDISAGGVCFISATRFDPKMVVNLKIDISGWNQHKRPYSMVRDIASEVPLSVIGEVAWCRPLSGSAEFEIGISFNNIYEDDFRALVRYLDSLAGELPDIEETNA
ncbi:MAG: PilZ domain-containing protein [Desulfosalsimonadaceae bacterium]|nr:PilZ domain-containing protein [Desulfosalsimonadaceae bacterium]